MVSQVKGRTATPRHATPRHATPCRHTLTTDIRLSERPAGWCWLGCGLATMLRCSAVRLRGLHWDWDSRYRCECASAMQSGTVSATVNSERVKRVRK